ncbi:tapasin [Latimeria chalumnae]|uniref:TAP binding protein n=1 Tax=Latimeria chalumnae TaxID=7897 RepID=H3AL76_LATCH|nr:PREDICTED: tapasin [Latimeria chalumnae]|eukprot:XP_006001010.1 PREDICTED: tapasin [Latimeria chalumnae]
MTEISTIYKLGIMVAAFFQTIGVEAADGTSLGILVDCWFVEEGKSRMGFPTAVTQKNSLLLLRKKGDSGTRRTALDFTPPSDLQPGMLFDITDPTKTILDPNFRGLPAPACEMNRYFPQEAFVDWASHLTGDGISPLFIGGEWYTSNIKAANHKLSISSIQKVVAGEGQDGEEMVKATSIVLNVFTRTPEVQTKLSRNVMLDCGFTVDRESNFSVEWRYQYEGSGHLVYAYDGLRDRVEAAVDGVEMFFEELHGYGNASLLIHNVGVKHEGTYICTVYMPYLHAQQAIDLVVREPPKLSLSPDPLYLLPGKEGRLACEITNYFPLQVSIRWTRKNSAEGSELEYLTQSWQTSDRDNPDGTYSVTGYVRIEATPEQHEALYTCHVSHSALKNGAKKSITLKIAGASGPSIEDAIGMFIIAFVLYGILKFLYWFYSTKVSPLLFGSDTGKKKKSE